MKVSFPVSLSGQIALQKSLDAVANNVANANTVGFRAETMTFSTALSLTGDRAVAFSLPGHVNISRENGPAVRTENPMDVAINGDGWMSLKGPNGKVFTRDGRIQMTGTGELVSVTGLPILDVGGEPLVVNARGGPLTIARDGMISQAGKQVGAIGLFKIPADAKLTRHDNSSVSADKEPEAIIEFSRNGFAQGFLEKSNVNSSRELSNLIQISRNFETLNSLLEQNERTTIEAIKALGTGS